MKILRSIAGIIVSGLVIAFILMNRQSVTLFWSPLHAPLTGSLAFFGFIIFGAGFLTGSLAVSINHISIWGKSWKLKRIIRKQQSEIDQLARPDNTTDIKRIN